MADIIKSRRDTAENWRTANPTLAEGELGFETDTKRYKLGDGKKAWNDLEYFNRDVDNNPSSNGDNLITSNAVFKSFINGFVSEKFNFSLYKGGLNIYTNPIKIDVVNGAWARTEWIDISENHNISIKTQSGVHDTVYYIVAADTIDKESTTINRNDCVINTIPLGENTSLKSVLDGITSFRPRYLRTHTFKSNGYGSGLVIDDIEILFNIAGRNTVGQLEIENESVSLEKINKNSIDDVLTPDSNNLISSDGVYKVLESRFVSRRLAFTIGGLDVYKRPIEINIVNGSWSRTEWIEINTESNPFLILMSLSMI